MIGLSSSLTTLTVMDLCIVLIVYEFIKGAVVGILGILSEVITDLLKLI